MIRKKMEIRKRGEGSARNLKRLRTEYYEIQIYRERDKWENNNWVFIWRTIMIRKTFI